MMIRTNNSEASKLNMQAAAPLCSAPHLLPSAAPKPPRLCASISRSQFLSFRTKALAVNYNSTFSVFPAEACETIGGDSCMTDMFPEVKLGPAETNPNMPKYSLEPVDRDYVDYTNDPRTVLLGEACDILGGDFCHPAYTSQQEIY